MEHSVVSLELGERGYDIVIGKGLLGQAGEYIAPLLPIPKAFIITDETVANLHLATVELSLKAQGVEVVSCLVPAGENTKRFEMLEQLLNEILRHKPERKTTLIALGGGVVGDLTGFAASILLRGVNFIQIPTTVLAQVDSSVGGKTGINTPFGKNLVGSFYQPQLVLIDVDSITTLSEREFLAGYAEVVKYGLIHNAEFFDWLDANRDAIKARNEAVLAHCVQVSCEAKASIVAQDEREGGVRALLNLGHTFGHALEAEMGYTGELLHGEAVAVGMVMAFAYSAQQGLCTQEDVEKVKAHLRAVGLPVSPYDIRGEWDMDLLLSHMYQDKKVDGGKLVFILAKGIGQSFIQKDVDAESVRAFLKAL